MREAIERWICDDCPGGVVLREVFSEHGRCFQCPKCCGLMFASAATQQQMTALDRYLKEREEKERVDASQ